MGFDRRDNAKTYTPQDGDTLRTIAERETAAGNPITWQELAQFNWGTVDENEINAFLRDELGARNRNAENDFVLAADDKPHGEILIPVRFQRRGLALGKTHTLRVRNRKAPPQFMECCHLPGITFALNSSFIRPTVAGYLKKLEALAGRFPDTKIMIFGHTDASGEDLYNKKLSERRAWSVYAFITNDPEAWEVLYNHPDEDWGLSVIQEMLADLGHNPGPPDGSWGPQTRAAMRSFLELSEDAPVQNDAAIRGRLFGAYMASKHDIDLSAERFMDPGYMGCGEFNLAVPSEGVQKRSRRVTFFLFHPERLPRMPCAFADVGPCKKQMVSESHRHKEGFRCSFYDSLSVNCHSEGPANTFARVYLLDAQGAKIPRARWCASVGETIASAGAADDAGMATIPLDDLPDVIELQWNPPIEAPEASDDYIFASEYHVHMPERGEEAFRRMLSNLGFNHFEDLADNVVAFQRELTLHVTGVHADIAELLSQWHNTGNRPNPDGLPSETGESPGERDGTLEDDGVTALDEETVQTFDEEGSTSFDDEGEPLHPEDVMDLDHDD